MEQNEEIKIRKVKSKKRNTLNPERPLNQTLNLSPRTKPHRLSNKSKRMTWSATNSGTISFEMAKVSSLMENGSKLKDHERSPKKTKISLNLNPSKEDTLNNLSVSKSKRDSQHRRGLSLEDEPKLKKSDKKVKKKQKSPSNSSNITQYINNHNLLKESILFLLKEDEHFLLQVKNILARD